MWATLENPNEYFRKLCWLKTAGIEAQNIYKNSTGIDIYVREGINIT